MTNPCGCGDNSNHNPAPTPPVVVDPTDPPPAECPANVHETVCVQAEVTITPHVEIGDIESFCIDGPRIGPCPGTATPTCTFTVSQSICVQIPLTFSATAVAVPNGIVCGTPETGLCSQQTGCTHTIGFFRTHPTETNALITAAGGSIVLGIDSLGLSFTVTTANATDVLSFNTPSPPAPSSAPFAQQYQVLYAQLLAAQLNVLNGATCPFATAAINAANTFLATSPVGGMAGAPDVQDPLAQFNEGAAPGCPAHCSGG